MKKLIIAAIALSTALLFWFSNQSTPNTLMVFNPELTTTLNQSIAELSTLNVTATPAPKTPIAENQPSFTPRPASTAIPELASADENVEPALEAISFGQAYARILLHLEKGLSKADLVTLKNQGLASNLPIAWLFSYESETGIDDKWPHFLPFDIGAELVKRDKSQFDAERADFLAELELCITCEHTEAFKEAEKHKFYTTGKHSEADYSALAMLNHYFSYVYFIVYQDIDDQGLTYDDYTNAAHELITSENEFFQKEGRLFLALLNKDEEQIAAQLIHSNTGLTFYLSIARTWLNHDQLTMYNYISRLIATADVDSNSHRVLEFAFYHAQYYSISQALALIKKMPERYSSDNGIYAKTLIRAQQLGYGKLSDKWLNERSHYDEIANEIQTKYQIDLADMQKTYNRMSTDLFKQSYLNIFPRWQEYLKKLNTDELALLNKSQNWSLQVEAKTPYLNGTSGHHWNLALEVMLNENTDHTLDAISTFHLGMIQSWAYSPYPSIDNEVRYIYDQLLPEEKQLLSKHLVLRIRYNNVEDLQHYQSWFADFDSKQLKQLEREQKRAKRMAKLTAAGEIKALTMDDI